MNNNSIDEVWKRILKYSSDTGARPVDKNKLFYTVARRLEFWLEKIANNNGKVTAVLPHNKNNATLFQITRGMVEKDINIKDKTDGAILRAGDFGQPAPSYRHALINDNRIWL